MSLDRVTPTGLYPAHGFTHAIVATGSRIAFIGGQVASDLDGEIIGPGDYEQQGEVALRNFALAVQAAGATMADVVQLGVYVVDGTPEHQKQVLAGLATAGAEVGLRRTTMKVLGVQALGNPAALVEYDGIAVLD